MAKNAQYLSFEKSQAADRLRDALQEANRAMAEYLDHWDVPTDGGDYFTLAERTEWLEAADEHEQRAIEAAARHPGTPAGD